MGTVQTIETESGETLVVLTRRDYDALLARAGDEDAEDRMTLLIAAEARGEKPLPAEVSAGVLEGASLLEALRRWRGLTLLELAAAAGLSPTELGEIEGRAKAGSTETLARLAKGLDVPVGWLE